MKNRAYFEEERNKLSYFFLDKEEKEKKIPEVFDVSTRCNYLRGRFHCPGLMIICLEIMCKSMFKAKILLEFVLCLIFLFTYN